MFDNKWFPVNRENDDRVKTRYGKILSDFR